MNRGSDWLKRLALGAASGFAGTLALQAARAAGQRWMPEGNPPIRQEPGEYMVESFEEQLPPGVRESIPEEVEAGAAQMLAVGYGLTFGALYAAVRPRGGPALVDGVALGVATWAAGYLGWLPAVGLMPPVWEQEAEQATVPIAQHALYGMVTVAAYDWLRRRVS